MKSTEKPPKITRAWSMPNRFTFQMKPVTMLLKKLCHGIVVDPFSGNSEVGTIRNDINQSSSADHHMDGVDFLRKLQADGVRCDVLLVDPPYSPRQMKECYSRPGMGRLSCSTSLLMGQIRDLAPKIVKDGGIAVTFGWNSNGIGNPFKKEEILLIAHGSAHNDTICVVERLLSDEPCKTLAF